MNETAVYILYVFIVNRKVRDDSQGENLDFIIRRRRRRRAPLCVLSGRCAQIIFGWIISMYVVIYTVICILSGFPPKKGETSGQSMFNFGAAASSFDIGDGN